MSKLLFEDVERWSAERPSAVAVVATMADGTRQETTYGELNAWSNRIARQLIDAGVEPGDRVAVSIPKGATAIAAMLAAAKVGAPYVPVDPESPVARIALILDAAEPRLLVADPGATDSVAAALAIAPPLAIATLDDGDPEWPVEPVFGGADVAGQDSSPLTPPPITSNDLAHVLFTSGSTGTPKGVMITHDNVMACIDWTVDHFGYEPTDRVSGHSPLHFDLSTFDIYAAFAAGATLHPVPSRVNVNPSDLAEWIRSSELTQWFSVPSALNHLVRHDAIEANDFPSLRRLIWCGEVLPTPTLIALMEALPHVEFTNLYGPTEATIASSWYRVPSIPGDPTEPIPIGQPLTGERLFVLDEAGNEVSGTEVGDLYIEGVGLSPGYWRDDDKTAAAFRRDLIDGLRLYRTGDTAWRRDDGEVMFVGRKDNQVKSRGYRIELGEIEAALRTVDGIDDLAVVAVEVEHIDGAALCAAYVSSIDQRPALVAKELGRLVPRYMLPHDWCRLEELPKNVNGKIDRPLLRDMFVERFAERNQ